MFHPRHPAARAAGLLVCAAALSGCSLFADADAPDPAAQAPPPAPPAACLLDTAALAAATGVTWTPDQTTATDTRCVYDPAAAPAPDGAEETDGGDDAEGPAFLAVDVTPLAGDDPAAGLDTVAGVCTDGSRAPVTATDGGGFVCRLPGGSVYAATVRGGELVTVAASTVPPGTTAARLVVAVSEQLGSIGS
ncbi:hypothetical protein [Pseudonocardia nigra]|uniref:hypothetical protein n=1 Tax=Pseudonocardia nigra TaxID=1921578 RepID=UPI001C5DCD3B|nr:hypothetical protein [Pseudonocardia nigra]